jgi:hypothetical protein
MFTPTDFELSPAPISAIGRDLVTDASNEERLNISKRSACRRSSEGENGRRWPRELIRYGVCQTSIAAFLLALSDKGVVAILIQEHPGDEKLVAALQARFPRAAFQHDGVGTREMVESVVNFVEDPRGKPCSSF